MSRENCDPGGEGEREWGVVCRWWTERERPRQRERESKRVRVRERECVCVRERERELYERGEGLSRRVY